MPLQATRHPDASPRCHWMPSSITFPRHFRSDRNVISSGRSRFHKPQRWHGSRRASPSHRGALQVNSSAPLHDWPRRCRTSIEIAFIGCWNDIRFLIGCAITWLVGIGSDCRDVACLVSQSTSLPRVFLRLAGGVSANLSWVSLDLCGAGGDLAARRPKSFLNLLLLSNPHDATTRTWVTSYCSLDELL